MSDTVGLEDQKERIKFWSDARLGKARGLRRGWFKLASEARLNDTSDIEEDIRGVCRALISRGKTLGFPGHYLSLTEKEIDIRVRFPSTLYTENITAVVNVRESLRRSYRLLLLLHYCHSNKITGVSYPDSGILDVSSVSYTTSYLLRREDVKRYGKYLQQHNNIAPLQDCIRDALKGHKVSTLLENHFSEFTGGTSPKPLYEWEGRRQCLPLSTHLEILFEEAKRYPEDNCRAFLLAFDWLYRVSEGLSYTDLPRDLLLLARSMFSKETTPDKDSFFGDDFTKRRNDIILVLDGALVIEPLYTRASKAAKASNQDYVDGGVILALINMVVKPAMKEPYLYLEHLQYQVLYQSVDTSLEEVRMCDIE